MTSLDIKKELNLYDIQPDLTIAIDKLPRRKITGELEVRRAGSIETRCSIQLLDPPVYKGGYGTIRRAIRFPNVDVPLCIKSPHLEHSFTTEALIQWIAAETLEKGGEKILGAVPRVYDIYQFAGNTCFSMEYIEGGLSALELIATTPGGPDAMAAVFFQVLAQAALLTGILAKKMRLDHRDLKGDNLWIRRRAVSYSVEIDGQRWRLDAPFQVVILDFGFACIGGTDGYAFVNLGAGLLPRLDPCPKEGRDLFQLIASFWLIPSIRDRLPADVFKWVEDMLTYNKISYGKVMRLTGQFHLTYGETSDRGFRCPSLEPVALLKTLADNWRGVGLLKRI